MSFEHGASRVLGEIISIQYLRAIAAIAVLVFHLAEAFEIPFDIGSAGVDIFFVISGFIMWAVTSGRPTTPLKFMRRRLTRIVPLYWIVTCTVTIVILLKPQFMYGNNLTWRNFLGSLFFLPALNGHDLHPVVLQGWTLSYEMMFYILFAMTLLLREIMRLWLLLGALALIAVLHGLLPMTYAKAFTSPVVLEFAGGAIIARLWTCGTRLPSVVSMAMLMAGFLAFAVYSIVGAVGLPRLVVWGIPSVLIVAGAVFAERERPQKPLRLLSFFGEASYSIYLWHGIVIAMWTALLLRIGVPRLTQLPLLLVLTLASTALLYVAVEKPLTRLLHPRNK